MDTKEHVLESEEHQALRHAVRRLLERHGKGGADLTDGQAGQVDLDLWGRLANEIGVCGLAVPEDLDGAGFGARELALVAEELGRRLLPSPFLPSVAMGTQLLLEAGDPAALEAHLPALLSGTRRATVLLPHHGDGWSVEETDIAAVRDDGSGYRLRGRVTRVLDGHAADLLIVPARAEDGTVDLYLVTEFIDVARRAQPSLDHTRAFAEVILDGCAAVRVAAPDAAGAIDRAMSVAAVCLAAEQLGVAQHLFDAAVKYAKDRHQFGRPIGSFQAVKHKLADSLLELELARATVNDALGQLESGDPSARRAVSVAKLVSSEAGYVVCANAMQVFGGIGVTWEHEAHLYFKRASTNRVLLGRPGVHRELIASSLSL